VAGSATVPNILPTDLQRATAVAFGLAELWMGAAPGFGVTADSIACLHGIVSAATVGVAGREGT
jgi:L-lactate permease